MAVSQFNEHTRRIIVSGMIREESAAVFLEQISALEFLDVIKPITVYIDTYGGSIDAALSMYDAMLVCACPIKTIGIGKIMSAGVLLLAAGDKGQRFISPNARVMMHQVSGGAQGTVKDIDIVEKEMVRIQDLFVDLLAKHTSKNKKQILQDIAADKYMSAQESLNYGIVDFVLTSKNKKKLK